MATSVPEHKPKFPGENILRMRPNPMPFMLKLAHDYGDIVTFKIGRQQIYLLNNPEYIKQVLVTQSQNFVRSRSGQQLKHLLGEGLLTSEGAFHLRQRRLTQPAFHRQRIATYAQAMIEYAARRRERWQAGQELDMHEEMMSLTLEIVAKTLFDADMQSKSGEVREAMATIMEVRRGRMLFFNFLNKLPLPSNKRFREAKAKLDTIIYRLINERRAEGKDHGDLLSMLIEAHDTEGDGGQMNNVQLRDEVITLFLAGHETTANLLTWTWYLLSQNPRVEAALHAELDAVLGGKLPTYEDLPKLTYTEKIITEAMRIYPPAWIVGRRPLKDVQVGDYTLKADSTVFSSMYLMHHNSRYYPEPEVFKPERWTPEFKASLPKFAYFPFGGGPRLCIGEPFAWVEAELLLAVLAQQWKMRLAPDQKVALQPLVTLRPRYGMRMRLEQRKESGEQTKAETAETVNKN